MALEILHKQDPHVADLIRQEALRQDHHIELIASENIASPAVLEALGTVLTNKYAEGYPGRRYYGGCEVVDQVERLAQDRAQKLFGCGFANVQPHSGSQANQAAFLAFLKPGDTLLSLSLSAGGHLTHGSPVNLSGKWFRAVHYGLTPEAGLLDMNQVERLARQHRPRLIIAGASAYPRTIDFRAFRDIADVVGALLMVDMAHIAGLVAAGVHPSPFPHAHVVTSTTHKTLRGPRGGLILTQDPGLASKINSALFPGIQGGPLLNVIAAKAVCFQEALQPSFKRYAQDVVAHARTLGESLGSHGWNLVSGGTDTHLLLMDLRGRGVTGKEAEHLLEHVGLVCNKNSVPQDPLPPQQTSGIRLGTPAGTTRGLTQEVWKEMGTWIHQVLHHHNTQEAPQVMQAVKEAVGALCQRYPPFAPFPRLP